MILCLSQIHTGTVSTLAWLDLHEESDGVLLSTEVYESLDEPKTIYHEHIRRDHQDVSRMARSQIVLAWNHPTIIPLRDPLAALISYQHRAEETGQIDTGLFQPTQVIVDRWIMLAESEERLRKVNYLAWDLPAPHDRPPPKGESIGPTGLWDTAQALGLRDPRPSRSGLPKLNTSGDYPLKDAYQAGDFEALFIGVLGIAYLIEAESRLRPFLERRGYRDLLWWRS